MRGMQRPIHRMNSAACVIVLCLFSGGLCAQETAYAPVDAQIPGPKTPEHFQAWLANVKHWRRERLIRIGYEGSEYARPELEWTERDFVCVQMMIEERNFFDRSQGKYTVDRYLDGLESEFGGVDSVLVWNTYPNLGIDDRNQYDRLRDMPGGVAGVRQMIADFHRRGVRVLFPETPWDEGTRDEGLPHWTAQARLMASVGADGLLGDTLDGVPRAFRVASDQIGHPLALQPEGLPADEALAWNGMTWGYWSFPFVPMISRYKWLEHRHMSVVTTACPKKHLGKKGPAFSFNFPEGDSFFNVNETHIFSPTMLNEAKFGFSRTGSFVPGNNPSVPSIGLNDGVAGFGIFSSIPFGFFQMNYEWKDILTKYQGKHNLKMGVEFRRGHDDFFSVSKPSYTFQNILDFATDQPIAENLSVDPKTGVAKGSNYEERTFESSAFIQDDYKVAPRLTLNLGLRWEDYHHPTENFGDFANLIAGTRCRFRRHATCSPRPRSICGR